VQQTAKKTSLLIENQLAGFIGEEYELFGKFIQKYYEQLELQGQPLDIANHLATYRDIDFYEKSILKQSVPLTQFAQATDVSLTVGDTSAFPDSGYLHVDDEICFYKSKSATQFLEVSRGVSGNTELGDLYKESTFVTTNAADHQISAKVHNISNLFLFALVKSFESQYLPDFPTAFLNDTVDQRNLIKNIADFYKSKGTAQSIKFLFKCLVKNDPEPEVKYPREQTLKSSESTWIKNYSLKAKLLSGTPESFIGKRIVQNVDGAYASAVIDNVLFNGTFDGEDLYELILAEETVNGTFSLSSKTTLTTDIDYQSTSVDVFSTLGWSDKGKFTIGNETFTFDEKTIDQFVIKTRSASSSHYVGDLVYDAAEVTVGTDSVLILGVLYNASPTHPSPYANVGEKLEISDPGFVNTDVKIFDSSNNIRWDLTSIKAIFEDGDDYYIASPNNQLRILPKEPTLTTEIYKTNNKDIGIFLDGSIVMGARHTDSILNGAIQKVDVVTRGSGYAKEPFVLINDSPTLARAKLAGQVVESVIIDTPMLYTSTPTVEITSGRGAVVTPIITNGAITSIVVTDPGEYYSSPPVVRILDLAGKGRFAEYTTEVSNDGELTACNIVTAGSGYSAGNIRVDIIAVGSGATGTASIRSWTKDRYNLTGTDPVPAAYRANDTGASHSPLLGYAYDGNPIYGAYGYGDPLDASSAVTLMTSSYSLRSARSQGPSKSTYPLGTFFEDYEYTHKRGTLDQNNGRFCLTPEYPNGVYAYFVTVDGSTPVFPYILGENYYGVPRDSNYNQSLTHNDVPKSSTRLRTTGIAKNGDKTTLIVDEINTGSISSVEVVSSTSTFSVGSTVEINNEGTGGHGVTAEVSSVKGKAVESIESQETQGLLINLSNTAYLFDGDTITQTNTGSTGKIVGNVFSGSTFTLRDVNGVFTSTDQLYSNTQVITLILDENSSYTKGANLAYTDGVATTIAIGEVLESTASKNTVKVKVTTGDFVVTDDYFIRSSNLIDSVGSKLLSTNSLSAGLNIFTINDHIALLKTNGSHGVGIGDDIEIDINPDDSVTTTTQYVRSRIYQEVTFVSPAVSTTLNDSGIGRITILNGGEDYTDNFATPDNYRNIALKGGSGSGATADFQVDPSGSVVSVIVKNKGTGYKKSDILTVGDADLAKTDLTTPALQVEVDHIGLGVTNTIVNFASNIGFTKGDYIKIDDEILLLQEKNVANQEFTVQRGQKGTKAVDHYNGATITLDVPGYTLNKGYKIGEAAGDPVIQSYDPVTQKAQVVWDYDDTLSTIIPVSLSTVFYDTSEDKRLVRVSTKGDPIEVFEFSTDQINFSRNPILNIKKFYSYKFDVSHSSMSDREFDISPSINYNINTPEKLDSNNIVDLKLGFGARVATNTYSTKVPLSYSKYYYFDRNGGTSSETGYLNVVDDPLQGIKKALYVTNDTVVYDTGVTAPHDGSGTVTYTSMSKFSVGAIDKINVINVGGEYKKLPLVVGVTPTETLRSTAITEVYNGSISGVTIVNAGSNYSKPKVIVEGNAVLTPVVNNGSLTGIIITDAGSDYTVAPEVTIVESDIRVYLSSVDIGIPRNIRIINNGGAYHNDTTLDSTIRSNYILKVSDFTTFRIGETIVQGDTARATVTAWRDGSNILSVKDVTGLFREGLEIKGLAKGNTAKLESISYTEFTPNIKTYFDNLGSYSDDQGIVSSSNQKITDTYYYQDYSYVVKSRTSIDIWRDLIKKTTHPAGFQLFGEVLIESDAQASMSPITSSDRSSRIQLWDPNKNKITVVSTKKQITVNIIKTEQLKVEQGLGSVSRDTFSTEEIRAKQLFLNADFTGGFTDKGNLEGQTTFVLVDVNGNSVSPYNAQALTITLDGVMQEPGSAYAVNGSNITFSSPPLGPRNQLGQDIPQVKFYCRWFEFKTDALNARYLKKLRNIYQRSGTWIDAANQLSMNRAYIQSETLGFIKAEYPDLSWGTLGPTCHRDIGLIVDSFEHDLRFGGNSKTIGGGEAYYNNDLLDFITGEIEPTIKAFEKAKDLAVKAMRNTLTAGEYTSLDPYINLNIRTGSPFTPKCADVESALDSLYENLKQTIVTGPGTATKSLPDYVNNENKIFDLYYDDGEEVVTDVNENLIVSIGGIVQHDSNYSIDRTTTPNKIVFTGAPVWQQQENTKTVQEPLAVDNIALHGIGNYIRCEIETSGILDGSAGPFLILDSVTKEVKKIDDADYAYVFVDGVLQRDTDSYSINGPAIRFTRKINRDRKVEIIVLYGRDAQQTVTLHDFEPGTYFNRLSLRINDSNSLNDFRDLRSWFNTKYDFNRFAYQKVGTVKHMIGEIKKIEIDTVTSCILTIAGNNPVFNGNEPIYFSSDYINFSDEFSISLYGILEYQKDEYGSHRMQRNASQWLYDSTKADDTFYKSHNLISRLNKGDVIKIDGEDSWRDIQGLPRYVNPKNYNPGAEISSKFFGSVTTTNYSGDTRGVGLSVTCTIDNGKVVSLEWNKKNLKLYYDEGILEPTTAYGYDSTPVLHFIPEDGNGGGAHAEVIVSKGQIIDIKLIHSGSGYTNAPKVSVARKYKIIKRPDRKIDSMVDLIFSTAVLKSSPVTVTTSIDTFKGVEIIGDTGIIGGGSGSIGLVTNKPVVVSTIQKVADLSGNVLTKELIISWPTSVTSALMGTSIEIEIERSRVIRSSITLDIDVKKEIVKYIETGAVDTYKSYFNTYGSAILGPTPETFNRVTYNTGDVLSTGGRPVSEYTVEEVSMWGITIEEIENSKDTLWVGNVKWNFVNPSINYYISQLNTADLPDEAGAGYLASGAIVYANTSNFAATGTILVGREQITYTGKLSDRFTGCTRGVNGTPIEEHLVGQYIRNAL
tara:strand:+ start:2465 stop:11026 length:8562 start_codon:yes stop_codon:yes gene_type:complete